MAVSAVLKIGAKIAGKSANILKGVTKSTLKNAKIKKRMRVAEKRYMRRRKLEKKRREQEALLEQQDIRKNTDGKKAKGSGKSPLQRLISLLQALIIGFIVNKLPKIIETIQKIVKTIKDVIDKVKNFFKGIFDFFKSIGKVVGKVFSFITSIDLSGISDNIKNALGTLTGSIGEMNENFNAGAREIGGVKLDNKNGEKDSEDKNTKLQSSVGDMQQTIDSQSDNFKNSMNTIIKSGDGSTFADNERVQAFREQVKDIEDPFRNTVIQTSDGRELRRGDEGFDEELSKVRNAMRSSMTNNDSKLSSNPTINSTAPQNTSDNISSINRPKKVMNTSTITMDRKPKNTVVLMGSNDSQTQINQNSSDDNIIIIQNNNTLKDHFVLALS